MTREERTQLLEQHSVTLRRMAFDPDLTDGELAGELMWASNVIRQPTYELARAFEEKAEKEEEVPLKMNAEILYAIRLEIIDAANAYAGERDGYRAVALHSACNALLRALEKIAPSLSPDDSPSLAI